MANALSTSAIFSTIKTKDIGKLAVESLFCLLRPAILVLLNSGIKVVVTTLGSDGVLLCFKKELGFSRLRFPRVNPFSRQLYETVNSSCPPKSYINVRTSHQDFYALHIPAISASVVRLTGAGDCLVGGTVASLCAGLDIMQSVAVGIAAAKASVESESTVPMEYCLSKVAGMFPKFIWQVFHHFLCSFVFEVVQGDFMPGDQVQHFYVEGKGRLFKLNAIMVNGCLAYPNVKEDQKMEYS